MVLERAPRKHIRSLDVVDGLDHLKPLFHLLLLSEELHPYFDFCLLYRLDALKERRSFYLVDPGRVRDASGSRQSISLPYQVVITKQLATGQLYELERTVHLCLCQ